MAAAWELAGAVGVWSGGEGRVRLVSGRVAQSSEGPTARGGQQDAPRARDDIMGRSRLGRYRDRQSYKASEVVGLFILSLFGGMLIFGLFVLVDWLLQRLFGLGTT